MADAATLAEQLADQGSDEQAKRREVLKAYREDKWSVLPSAKEIHDLDRETAEEIAHIVHDALQKRDQLKLKRRQEFQRLQQIAQTEGERLHLDENDLDELPAEGDGNAKAYAQSLANRLVGKALNRISS